MSVATLNGFKRITCLYLPADDPDAIEQWYAEHFHLKKNHLREGQTLHFCKPANEGWNSNFITDDTAAGEHYEMFAACFETDCIRELHERLGESEVRVETLRDEGGCGLQFCFYDPQGNKFLVWQDPATETRPRDTGNPALIRIASVYFPVSDKEKTYNWYTQTIGLPVSEDGQPQTAAGQTFFFCRSVAPGRTSNFYTTGWSPGGAVMPLVNVEVEGLDSLFGTLASQGEWVSHNINDAGGCGRAFKLYDPDRNMLELWGGFPG